MSKASSYHRLIFLSPIKVLGFLTLVDVSNWHSGDLLVTG